MRSLLSLAVVGLILAFGLPASADPSTGVWTKLGSSSTTTTVSSGGTVVFAFPVGTANSTLLRVNSKEADVCFDADTAGAGGTGRATVKLALTATGSDNAAITLPALNIAGTDCLPIVSGSYWVQVDTAATATENPIVYVRGR